MPDSKRDTDVKNRLLDFVGEGDGTPLQSSCLENWTAEPGRLQSMGSLRVGHN